MMQSPGVVKLGEQTLLENIIFNIAQGHDPESGQSYWSGYFVLPVDAPVEARAALFNAVDFLIALLEDGRSGPFRIHSRGDFPGGADFPGAGTLVSMTGTASFQ